MSKKSEKQKPVGSDALVRHLCQYGGFVPVRCSKEWGGTYGWETKGGGCQICGYKTELAAMEGFIRNTAGSGLGKYMLEMLKKLYVPNSKITGA